MKTIIKTETTIVFLITFAMITSLFFSSPIMSFSEARDAGEENSEIYIVGNQDFEEKALEEDWPGEGTESDPYIIEGYDIDAAEYDYDYGIYIEDTDVHFEIRNSEILEAKKSGIYLENVTNGTLTDNYLEDQDEIGGEAGIHLVGSNENEIVSNTVWDNLEAAGLTLEESSRNLIEDNNISLNMGGGMDIINSHNNTIRNNYLWDSEGGIILSRSHGNTITENELVIGEGAIVLVNSDENEASHNKLDRIEDKAIILRDAEKNKIIENEIIEPGWFGIDLMEDVENSIIEDNSIEGGVERVGGRAIRLRQSSDDNHLRNNEVHEAGNWSFIIERSSGNVLENNLIEQNSRGVLLQSSNECRLEGNTMDEGIIIEGDSPEYWNTHEIDDTNEVNGEPLYYLKNEAGGTVPDDAGQVILASSTDITVSNQEMNDVEAGIVLGFSDDNTLEKNTVTASRNGIYLTFSDQNTLKENTLDQNEYGVYLDNSSQNLLYHNNFIENEEQASERENNTWNEEYPKGGNYWSDYDGSDHRQGSDRNEWGSDGLGDDPYEDIGGATEAEDEYPLMEPAPTPHLRIDSPEEGDLLNEEDVMIEWTTMDRFTDSLEHEVRLNQVEWIPADEETGHPFEDLEDGDHVVEVKAEDEEENQAFESVKFTVDTTPPSLQILDPEDGEFLQEDSVTVEWNGTDELSGLEAFYIRLNEEDWEDVGEETSSTLEGLAEGEHLVEVKARDFAGNEAVKSVSFTVDTQRPELEITSPFDGQVIGEDSFTVEWEATARGTDIEKYEVRIEEEWENADTENDHFFEGLNDGSHVVEVRVIDEAEHNVTEEVFFTIDTTPPEVNFVGLEDEAEKEFTEGSITIEWAGSDEVSDVDEYKVRLDGGEWISVGRDTSYTFEDLTEGEYEVEVKAIDEAGNPHTESITIEVEGEDDFPWWIIIFVVLGILIGVTLFVYTRKKRARTDEEPAAQNTITERQGEIYTCPDCGKELTFISEYDRWYCEGCEEYK